ncbi:hypothetical protein VKT23_008733 [Stygiomarasmius scandens]|uniref:Uncharacterized protein n=1 Tax=Marasmiellus scandens TaxID=2682957 RepID=A0ABR1JFG3_9AGAR
MSASFRLELKKPSGRCSPETYSEPEAKCGSNRDFGITLTPKSVSLKGFNGLKGGLKVETFSLPSNDPDGGITLKLAATTTSLSQVGVELSRLAFDTFASDVMIAPVATTNTVTLAPESSTLMNLTGRLVPQSSDSGLSVVSDIFNRFIHGQDSDVSVHGSGAGPSDVTWLNKGIKVLQIATVLPNRGPQSIIKSISLNQLTLDFTADTAYNPATSSDNTEASFGLPDGFDFPIDISALQQTISVSTNGQDFARLAIPKGPSTTDVDTRVIHLGFNNVPFAVSDGQQGTFNQFLAATTTTKSQTLGLSGSADADANTAVGLLVLKDISFSVDSTISGLNGLNEKPVTVNDLDINHGFPDFLLIKVNTALFNPSNLTIGTGDVSFTLQYQNTAIGEADLSDMVIKPGNQTYPTDVHYAPQGGAVAVGRQLLENVLQGVDVDTTISGSTDSTPIESLKTALSQIVLSPVTIPALHQSLIKAVSITFPEDIVQTGLAQTSFTLDNPFTASINLLKQPYVVFILYFARFYLIVVGSQVDQSALFLIGAVAGPVAQHLVDQSELNRLGTSLGFDLALHGSLTNTGPLDASIEFTEPVVVNWQGNNIATIELPAICAAADDGVPNYSTNTHLAITDNDKFTEFAIFLLRNEDFEWTISTDKLRVTALDTIFENVSLQKSVSFKAFGGLPGVAISNFQQLPSDDPAGGIHIETDSQIPSPALWRYRARSDLDAVGELFSKYLVVENQTLQVIGQSVQPPGSSGTVGWLTTAIQSLTLQVILPGQSFKIGVTTKSSLAFYFNDYHLMSVAESYRR